MKRILVTGASGFVGQHLCSYLARKRYPVIVSAEGDFPPVLKKFRNYPADFRNPSDVRALIRLSKPDVIIHLAAQSVPRESWKAIKQTFRVNVEGTINLLNAVRQEAIKAKLLFASTQQVYGKTFRSNEALDEKSGLWPENPYAVSKALAEFACLNFYQQFGLNVVILRLVNHIGIGQLPQFVISNWCRQAALSEIGKQSPILNVGNLDVMRDFIHVRDVLSAYEILIRKGKAGEIYNVASGRSRKMRDYAKYVLKLARVPMSLQIDRNRLRKEIKQASLRNIKIRKLGWSQKYSVFEAIGEVMDEWRIRLKRNSIKSSMKR